MYDLWYELSRDMPAFPQRIIEKKNIGVHGFQQKNQSLARNHRGRMLKLRNPSYLCYKPKKKNMFYPEKWKSNSVSNVKPKNPLNADKSQCNIEKYIARKKIMFTCFFNIQKYRILHEKMILFCFSWTLQQFGYLKHYYYYFSRILTFHVEIWDSAQPVVFFV